MNTSHYISLNSCGGQLGNKLFCIASAYILGNYLKVPVYIPIQDLNYVRYRGFLNVNNSVSNIKRVPVFLDSRDGINHQDVSLWGKNNTSFLKNLFDNINKPVFKIGENDIVVHYRNLFDCKKSEKKYDQQFKALIKKFIVNVVQNHRKKYPYARVSIVYMDCKNNELSDIKELLMPCETVSRSMVDDFLFVKNHKHIVLTPSTFGWWASYLSHKSTYIYYPLLNARSKWGFTSWCNHILPSDPRFAFYDVFTGEKVVSSRARERCENIMKLCLLYDECNLQEKILQVPPTEHIYNPANYKPNFKTTGFCGQRLCSLPFSGYTKIPVWMYVEHNNIDALSQEMVKLNIRNLKRFAPDDEFDVHIFNRSEASKLVVLPKEWKMCENACFSDIVRTAIMAQHGGIYIDADVLVNRPLSIISNDLKWFDIVSYESQNQNCKNGYFSSNFLATRPGVHAYKLAYETLVKKMKKKCYKNNEMTKCKIGWAEFGEVTSHYITHKLVSEKNLSLKCYSGTESFTPWGHSKKYNMFHIYTASTDDNSCKSKEMDLICEGKKIKNFYNRIAYHTFNSIHGRFYSNINMTKEKYVISELYKKIL